MLVEEFKIDKTSPCLGDGSRMKIRAVTTASMKEIMPYLNSVIANAMYFDDLAILTFKKGVKLFNIKDSAVKIAKLENITEAYKELDWFKKLVNDTYDKRDTITPMTEPKKRPTALQIYMLLPRQISCGKCGEKTCLAFACKLLQGEAHPDACEHLKTCECENKKKLYRLLGF